MYTLAGGRREKKFCVSIDQYERSVKPTPLQSVHEVIDTESYDGCVIYLFVH